MQLPSLNEYTYACRSHWSVGRKFKAETEGAVCLYVKRAIAQGKCRKTENPCEIYIEWHEQTRKRDADNIQSAQKFILDALKDCGVIPDDSRKYVRQIYHRIVDDKEDRVIVTIKEADAL